MRRGQCARGGTRLKTVCLALALSAAGCASTVDEPATLSAGPPPAAQAEGAETVKLQNTLRWRTASEVDNFGFDVYRGPSEQGPFARLNDESIAGAGTTDEPQDYTYVDDSIEAGIEYWYYVESLSMSGERRRFTPVFKGKAKYPDDHQY